MCCQSDKIDGNGWNSRVIAIRNYINFCAPIGKQNSLAHCNCPHWGSHTIYVYSRGSEFCCIVKYPAFRIVVGLSC